METMQELLPFAKELVGRGSNRHTMKVYLVGAAVAVLGTVLGLLDTVCQPFLSGETLEEEMLWSVKSEKAAADDRRQSQEEAEVLKTEPKKPEAQVEGGKRNLANRLHAS